MLNALTNVCFRKADIAQPLLTNCDLLVRDLMQDRYFGLIAFLRLSPWPTPSGCVSIFRL